MDDPARDSFPPGRNMPPHQPRSVPLHQRLARAWSELLASSCLLCGEVSGEAPICPACRADLPSFSPANACPVCAESGSQGEVCGRCLRRPPPFTATWVGWRYAFPVDRLIQALKYQHRLPLAGWFGSALADRIPDRSFDRIVPLPLHPQRLAERGFNQSVLIAEALGKCLQVPVDRDSLQRSRPTPPQATQPYRQRQANVRGAFAGRDDYRGERLLLVDDVMTTSATLREAARVLRLHGAAAVELAVVARALRDDRRILLAAGSVV